MEDIGSISVIVIVGFLLLVIVLGIIQGIRNKVYRPAKVKAIEENFKRSGCPSCGGKEFIATSGKDNGVPNGQGDRRDTVEIFKEIECSGCGWVYSNSLIRSYAPKVITASVRQIPLAKMAKWYAESEVGNLPPVISPTIAYILIAIVSVFACLGLYSAWS